jgi:GDPmannose 4,6-dehydratase
MFGKVQEVPQNEKTSFWPRSPYGVSKTYGHHIAVNYRESYDLFVVSGILFNHESPLRGTEFVTRKVTQKVASILLGFEKFIYLGNLDAKRDWGYAGDYVTAMWKMLQNDKPEDYVICTGLSHSVADLVKSAFQVVGIDNWQDFVKTDEQFIRPAEVNLLIGDYSKAKNHLDWEPKIEFKELIRLMVDADIDRLKGKPFMIDDKEFDSV